MNEIRKQKRNIIYLNLLLSGTILFEIGRVFSNYVYSGSRIFGFISLIGQILLIYSFFKLPKANFRKRKLQFMLHFFAFIGMITILRGVTEIPMTPYEVFRHNTFMWTYLMPLFMFIKVEYYYIKYFLYWCLSLIIFEFIFLVTNYNEIFLNYMIVLLGDFDTMVINRFSIAALIITALSAFAYVINRFRIPFQFFIISSFLLALLSSALGGRRSSAVLMIMGLIVCLMAYIKVRKKTFLIIAIIVCVFGTVEFDFTRFLDSYFEVMSTKIDKNTRESTEVDFINDFGIFDWIFGRGMSGTFKSFSVAHLDKLNRNIIETGYLNLILHGGILFLFPYLYFLCKSAYLGFFKSSNPYMKGFGIYIAINLIFLYPGGTPLLAFRYILLFMLMRFCITNYNKIGPTDNFDISKKILR